MDWTLEIKIIAIKKKLTQIFRQNNPQAQYFKKILVARNCAIYLYIKYKTTHHTNCLRSKQNMVNIHFQLQIHTKSQDITIKLPNYLPFNKKLIMWIMNMTWCHPLVNKPKTWLNSLKKNFQKQVDLKIQNKVGKRLLIRLLIDLISLYSSQVTHPARDYPLTPKISSVILLTVCHTALVMLVWRIWCWINL